MPRPLQTLGWMERPLPFVERAHRLKLVLGVERTGGGEVAVELQISQQRLDDERAGVVRRRQLADGEVEHVAQLTRPRIAVPTATFEGLSARARRLFRMEAIGADPNDVHLIDPHLRHAAAELASRA